MREINKNRVELHCHTGYSVEDGTASVMDIVDFAVNNDMTAVAFTDHANVMAYPEIQRCASRSEGLKPIYGVEAYVVNDIDMLGENLDKALTERFDKDVVVFDIEVTGFSATTNDIIEMGAVKIHDGQIVDRFYSFVKPNEALSEKIIELTGITNEQLEDADSIDVVLPRFLKFSEGSILSAFNSDFALEFIKVASNRLNIPFVFISIDTFELSKMLFPTLSVYSFINVAEACSVEIESCNTSDVSAEMYLKMVEMLKADGLETIGAVIERFTGNPNVINHSKSYHMTVLAKNMAGVQSIYKLVTDSNRYYNYKKPSIRLSEILANRENLLIGSACEAGILCNYILMGKTNEIVEKIAAIFDFLEIQPTSEININKRIIEIGRKFDIPVVATSDVHYLRPENAISRCVLKEYRGIEDADSIDNLHFRTTKEMLEEFEWLGEEKAYEVVIENTNKIAEQIEYITPLECKKVNYNKDGDYERLELLCSDSTNHVYANSVPDDAKNRLSEELNIIKEQGKAYYYLWFYDLLHDNNLNKTQYSLRGCGAGSLVCFLLGISHSNPLDKDVPLYSEFFMGINGDKDPDIDINIDADIWKQVYKSLEHLSGIKKTYRASFSSTFDGATIEKMISDYESSYKKLTDDEKIVIRDDLLNTITGTSLRSGGNIMIPEGVDDNIYSPLIIDNETGETTLAFDNHSIDHIFDKVDILRNEKCSLIDKLYKATEYYPSDEEIKDESLIKNVAELKDIDISEFSNPFMQELIKILKPRNYAELVKLEAIGHGTNTWLENGEVLFAEGKATLENLIGTREDVFEMMLLHNIDSPTSYLIAEDVRKGKMALGRMKPELREAMNNAGLPDWYIWSCEQVKYLFPRAHAAEYVQMELRLLHYKIHYPEIYEEIQSEY